MQTLAKEKALTIFFVLALGGLLLFTGCSTYQPVAMQRIERRSETNPGFQDEIRFHVDLGAVAIQAE